MLCVYTCVTNKYDKVSPVDPNWNCYFILFHDGTIDVPTGWRGVEIRINGLSGKNLNRYAKMNPHRLGLPSNYSLYVDGNVQIKQDPSRFVQNILNEADFSAPRHPEFSNITDEIRRALTLGYAWPTAAIRVLHQLNGLDKNVLRDVFECNILMRRHAEPRVVDVNEQWWSLWKGGYGRDQPLLILASAQNEFTIHPANIRARTEHDRLFQVTRHLEGFDRKRLIRRLLSELLIYRAWPWFETR